MSTERDHLAERYALVRRDLEELADQVAEGEVEAAQAERLRTIYEAELRSLESAFGGVPGDAHRTPIEVETSAPPRTAGGRSPRRMAAGTVLVIGALSLAIVLVGREARNPQVDPPGSSAGALSVDPATITNEQLEAVVAANPNVNGMRMALADRYFAAEEYQAALDHYLYVAANQPAPQDETKALARLGWMAYRTGLADAADDYVMASLTVDPTNPEAILFRGFISLYGLGNADAAIPQLEAALALPNLSDNVIAQIEDALADARKGLAP